jgi:hypothetical protein
VSDPGHERHYYMQVPNLLNHDGLSATAIKLYIYLKELGWQTGGEIDRGERKLSEGCGMNRHSLRVSRDELIQKGWIELIEEASLGRKGATVVRLLDRWPENNDHFAGYPRGECACSKSRPPKPASAPGNAASGPGNPASHAGGPDATGEGNGTNLDHSETPPTTGEGNGSNLDHSELENGTNLDRLSEKNGTKLDHSESPNGVELDGPIPENGTNLDHSQAAEAESAGPGGNGTNLYQNGSDLDHSEKEWPAGDHKWFKSVPEMAGRPAILENENRARREDDLRRTPELRIKDAPTAVDAGSTETNGEDERDPSPTTSGPGPTTAPTAVGQPATASTAQPFRPQPKPCPDCGRPISWFELKARRDHDPECYRAGVPSSHPFFLATHEEIEAALAAQEESQTVPPVGSGATV